MLPRPLGLFLPKETEGCREVLAEVIGLHDALIRSMADIGTSLRREIEHLAQRLGDIPTRHNVDKKSRGAGLDLIDESTGARGDQDRSLFPRPQCDFERDVGESFVSRRNHHYLRTRPLT